MVKIMSDIIKKTEELEKKSKEFGFYWLEYDSIMEQIHSEHQEIAELLAEEKIDQKRLQEEIGDLLHATISLCYYCGFSSEETLTKALNKFQKRFDKTKELAIEDGNQNLHDKTKVEMMKYWDMAKRIVG
jgi:uncharacterized protein YabN with tetrapyrrole methylase and pyrophosphatase domain